MSAEHTVQVGIRSSGERSAREYVQDKGGKIFRAKDIRGLDGVNLQAILILSFLHAFIFCNFILRSN